MAKASAARVFFDIVGTLQAQTLISDTRDVATVQQAILLDSINNITDNFDMASMAIIETTKLATEAFYEYERQMARVRKFYNGQEEAVQNFAAASVELGEAFAFSGAEALTASARTAQLKGVLESQAAIIEATRAGLLMSAVGEMETEKGMNRFIALAQQTQFLYGGLTKAQYDAMTAEQQANVVRGNSLRVLNQLNTIENSSVATMEDITFVLNQFASQADIAGESIGEMAAMSALLLETGEEVSRAGTGLRMIYQRIGNDNSEAVKALQQLMGGVEASVVTQMKLSDVIREISPAYQTMTAEQKRALAVQVAGSRHYVKFLKLMENSERLAELQTVAYEGQYTALDEFGEISKTAAFQQKQLDSAVTNLAASIGDKLTDSYQQATKAQLHLLGAADKFLDENVLGTGDLVKNLIGAAGIYQSMVKPFSESGMAIMNTVIAFKTLQGVTRSMNIEERHKLKSRSENMVMLRFMGQAEKENIVITSQSTNATARYNLAHKEAVRSMREHRAAMTFLNTDLRLMNDDLVFATNNIDRLGIFLSKARGEYMTTTEMQRRMALGMPAVEANIRKHKQAYMEQSAAMAQALSFNKFMHVSQKNLNILHATGIQGLVSRVNAQQQLNTTLGQYHALLADELLITVPLTEAEMAQARATLLKTEATLADTRAQRGNLQSAAARYIAQGKQVPKALADEIAALKAHENQLMADTAALHSNIQASNQASAAIKAATVANTQNTGSLLTNIKAKTKSIAAANMQATSIRGVTGAMMPIAMILPLITKGENQMAAMMVSSGLMMMSMIPMIKANTAAKVENAAATTAMSGGLNLLLAAGIATAAYFAAQKFDWFKDPLEDINALNDGMETFSTTLTGIMEKEGAVLAGVVDEGFADIESVEDASVMLDTLGQHLFELNDAYSVLGDNESLENQLMGDIKATEAAIAEVKAYSHALIQHAKLKEALETGEYDMGLETGFSMRARTLGLGDAVNTEEIEDNTKVSFMNRLNYAKDFYIEYTNLEGEFVRETFKNQKKMNERIAELEETFTEDRIAVAESYLDAILSKTQKTNAEIIGENEQMMGTILGDMFDFNNAREELFFGQRSNFQGALYKQVTQGGVENLMYKTEILQTNIFNGMTLPEMVDTITQGVITQMREQGVPVDSAAGL